MDKDKLEYRKPRIKIIIDRFDRLKIMESNPVLYYTLLTAQSTYEMLEKSYKAKDELGVQQHKAHAYAIGLIIEHSFCIFGNR